MRFDLSIPLDADQMRTFTAIAETGGFTAAARATSKTQSAVSMQMKRLEERVGQKLFVREGRRNALTPEGKKLLDYARRITRLNNEALNAMARPELTGHVRLGLPDDYAERFLPEILSGFTRHHPKAEVEVQCMGSSRLKIAVDAGEIDLAVVTHADTDRTGEVLRRERLNWAGSATRPLPETDTLPLAILPLAMGPQSCSWRRAAVTALDKADRAHRIAYVSSSAAAVCSAVVAGLAITVLPDSAMRPGLVRLADFPHLQDSEIALIRAPHHREGASPLVATLAEHIRDRIGRPPAALAMAAE